ncbi:MAG TPA: hypothetical protein VN714_01760 [Trebonia sp.]|nr:hypothetical protein [Trebonia sp.]
MPANGFRSRPGDPRPAVAGIQAILVNLASLASLVTLVTETPVDEPAKQLE